MKKQVIRAGERNSITIQAHFAGTVKPQPFLRNFPYGAEIKNSNTKTIAENPKTKYKEKK